MGVHVIIAIISVISVIRVMTVIISIITVIVIVIVEHSGYISPTICYNFYSQSHTHHFDAVARFGFSSVALGYQDLYI